VVDRRSRPQKKGRRKGRRIEGTRQALRGEAAGRSELDGGECLTRAAAYIEDHLVLEEVLVSIDEITIGVRADLVFEHGLMNVWGAARGQLLVTGKERGQLVPLYAYDSK
jgi:hypothetical protein